MTPVSDDPRSSGALKATLTGLDPVDGIALTVLVDNVYDALLQDEGAAKRPPRAIPGAPRVPARFIEGGEVTDPLRAEHGFSALLSVTKGDRTRHVLFDTGVSPDGLAENASRLGLSLKDIELVVLSHGHYDHTTGLDGFVRAVGRANLPLIIHPEFWNRRRIALPGREPFELPTTSRSSLLGAGFDIIENRRPSFLLDGSMLITGEVDRTTPFERGYPVHEALRGGEWQPDPLILDDQALLLNLRDRGLVVITGCGHAGIVNILRYAIKLTGEQRIHGVIGGFHLSGPLFAPIVPDVCAALVECQPSVLVPAHCTGWRAAQQLALLLPDAFLQTSVGTRFVL